MNPLSEEEDGVRDKLLDGPDVEEEEEEVAEVEDEEEVEGSPVSPGPAADVKSIANFVG